MEPQTQGEPLVMAEPPGFPNHRLTPSWSDHPEA